MAFSSRNSRCILVNKTTTTTTKYPKKLKPKKAKKKKSHKKGKNNAIYKGTEQKYTDIELYSVHSFNTNYNKSSFKMY